MMLLNSARQAFNDRNYPFAAERFTAFLREFGGHKQAMAARLGLGLTLLEGPQKDINQAIEHLQAAAGANDFPERGYAAYHLGLAIRLQGLQLIAQNPREGPAQAAPRFERAAQHFAAAEKAFAAMPSTRPANPAELPSVIEWANRARCDQAEMLMRLGKAKEVAAMMGAWLKDPGFARSRYRPQALYLSGHASFILNDHPAAVRTLSQFAPFNEPAIGVHARYLLARAHQLCGERPEALAGYEAVLSGFDAERKAAEKALGNPAVLHFDEKARLEALRNGPPPEYVARSSFYLATLLYEQGQFQDARTRFQAFIQQNGRSPLVPEAQLRMGVTLYQLKQLPPAMQALAPLADNQQLGDQALLWTGRAQIAAADPNNAGAFQQQVNAAIGSFKRCAEKAQQIAAKDPAAKVRRLQAMLEMADAQQLLKQYKEAAATYQRIAQEDPPADIGETTLQRLAAAMQLAGQYRESDETCGRFIRTYPKSQQLGEVLFRYAENTYLQAASIQATASDEAKRIYGEAIKRYQQVLAKHPDSPFTNHARQGLGTSLHQLGQYAEAVKVLSSVPEPERSGEMATVSYLLADCKLRTLPEAGEDALSMAKLIESLNECADLLNSFVGAQEGNPLPQGPDAIIKLGYTLQRIAALTADDAENKKMITRARVAYATFLQKYPNHPQTAVVLFEDAKCLAQIGDFATAASQLSRFRTDPLRNSPLAPLALVRYGDYLRQRKPADAVPVLQQVKQQYEQALLNDPARKEWVPVLCYAYAMALKESGKTAEARTEFEAIARRFAGTPQAAEAVWRSAQTRKDEALVKLETARKALVNAGGNADAARNAKATIAQATASLREAADYLASQAEQFAKDPKLAGLRVRMLYEAAWVNRMIADAEIDAAREKIVLEQVRKLNERMQVKDPQPMSASVLSLRAAEVPLTAIPLTPGEQKMRQHYQTIINSAADAPLTNDARFELGDQLARREEHDGAITLLRSALDADPPIDLLDRIRLRLGACFLGKNDPKTAADLFNAVLQNPRSPLAVHAKFGLGECCIIRQDWTGAIQHLLPFRDNEVFRTTAMTSDRAVLRLAQAYAQIGQWEPSRVSFEAVYQRFPYSPWINEARYGAAVALQNLKNYDGAVNLYNEVIARTATELAAKAQLQIGLCRMEQKRFKEAHTAFLSAAYTYDYPELIAWSLCEAAKAQVELKQPEEAKKLVQKVLKDNPSGRWNEYAQKVLATIK